MFAIYKKELGQYFHSMIGFVFLAFFLVIVGVYTWANNLASGLGNFEITLNSITFLFVILIPIVTMRVMAEENGQKTDQLLLTSPVSVTKIILGKYLAVMTLFTLAIAVISLYPLIFRHYNINVRLSLAYSSIIGFYLMGAAYIAIGTFISTLTESQIIAAVVSFITLLLTFLMSGITGMLPSDALSQCMMFAFAWLIICGIAYYMMANIKVAVGLAVVGEAAIWITYAVKSSLYDGLFSTVLNSVAVAARYDDFQIGILNYDAIVYYVTVAGLFIFLSIQAIKKKQYSGSTRLKSGAYNSFVTVLVVAVIVVVNLMFNTLDLTTDLSSGNLFTLSGDTNKVIKDMKQDVTLYYMVEEGNEFEFIDKVLAQYDKASDKIKVEKVDPVVNPSFAEKYVSNEINANDVIVVNNGTENAVHVAGSEMYYTDTQYSSNYTSTTQTPYLDVEGQITAAMQSVVSETSTKMYVLNGHKEQELGAAITDSFSKLNIKTEELTLYATDTGVPKDCDILMLNGPENDISDKEKEEILAYLKAGGNAVINMAYTTKKIPNILEILEYYGVEATMGNVIETAGHYYNAVNWIIPTVNTSDDIGAKANGIALFPEAVGFKIKENVREKLTASSILSSTDSSYLKVDLTGKDPSKTKDDIDGPFDVGVSVKEQIDDGKGTKLVVFGCANAFTDTLTAGGQFVNADLLKYSVTTMLNSDVELVSVSPKDLSYTHISVPIASQIMWAAILILIMPLGLLIFGGVVWFLRRR